MKKELLQVNDLHVRVEEKEILHGVNLSIGKDETHVLMGPNGTGKSTLGYAVTGNPAYEVTEGSIVFDGQEGDFPLLSEPAGGAGRDAERLHPLRTGAENRQPPAPLGLQKEAGGNHEAAEHG